MKLNAKGVALQKKWLRIWDAACALQIAMYGVENGDLGSDVVYQHDLVHTMEDDIGIMLAAHGDDALLHEIECIGRGVYANSMWALCTTCKEYVDGMAAFFDMSEEEAERVHNLFHSRVKVRRRVTKADAFTEDDKRTVQAIFGALLKLDSDTLDKCRLGSLAIEDMAEIHCKLIHEPYCKKYGLKSWHDMTEDDFVREYEERAVSEFEYEETREVWDEIYNPHDSYIC